MVKVKMAAFSIKVEGGFWASGYRCHTIAPLAILSLLPLLFVLPLHAETPSVHISVDTDQVGLNDVLGLTVTLSGVDADSLKVAGLGGFEVAGSSSGNNISIVNGRVSSSQQRTYQLHPKRTGKFALGPATVRSGGKTYRSESLQVTVVSGGRSRTAPAPGSGFPSFPFPEEERKGGSEPVPIVKLLAEPRQAYVNQQITLAFQVQHQGNITDARYSPPQITGFLVNKLPQPSASQTKVAGQPCVVERVPSALFAVKPGKFSLGPASLTFSFGVWGAPQTVNTNTVTIQVNDLPQAGRPAGFAGAVGDFKLAAHLDKTQVKRGEAVALTATVSGKGNVSSVRDLIVPNPAGFRFFPSSQKEAPSTRGMTITGSKTFEYVLVPDKSGTVNLGTVTLPVFIPSTGKYIVVRSEPLSLTVLPGPPASGTNPVSGFSGTQQARLLREDIRYIKGDRSTLVTTSSPPWRNPWYLGLHFAGVFSLIGAVVYRRKTERFQRDETLQRNVRGSQAARKWLREAESRSREGKIEEFYAALSRALTEYLASRLNVPVTAVSADSVSQRLATVSASEASVEKVAECLRRAEFARFAPSTGGNEDRQSLLRLAREVIEELEQVFRNAR
ncbi:MAG: protein BatD [Armatimonadetes bacterium]|nr:protein BatD [Armatimonadota bacterium]